MLTADLTLENKIEYRQGSNQKQQAQLRPSSITHFVRIRWSVMFVHLDDDAETDEYILLIVNVQQVEHEQQDVSDMRLQWIRCRQTVNQLQNRFPELLGMNFGQMLRRTIAQYFEEDRDRLF